MNASLKFLMPSKRHHPQVEPLLATYKILPCQLVAKWFFPAFKKQFLLPKFYFLKPLVDLMPLYKNLHCCFPSELRNSADFMRKNCCKIPFLPFLHSETNLHFYSLFSHHFPLISIFPHFPFIKSTLHSLKLLFRLYRNPQNPLKTIETLWKNPFFYY